MYWISSSAVTLRRSDGHYPKPTPLKRGRFWGSWSQHFFIRLMISLGEPHGIRPSSGRSPLRTHWQTWSWLIASVKPRTGRCKLTGNVETNTKQKCSTLHKAVTYLEPETCTGPFYSLHDGAEAQQTISSLFHTLSITHFTSFVNLTCMNPKNPRLSSKSEPRHGVGLMLVH